MSKIHQHIEIVRSTAPGLSSLSRVSAEALCALLRSHYAVVGITIVNTLDDLELLASRKPDLVFLGMKYLPSYQLDKVWIAEYLDEQGIEHTGSPRAAIELEFDKPLAKQRVLEARLQTAAYMVVEPGKTVPAHLPLTFPLFVKPTDKGGGQGVDDNSVVHDHAALATKLSAISDRYASAALVETYLPGREFSVAVLRQANSSDYSAMPIELVASDNERGDRILSQKVKSSNAEAVGLVSDPQIRAAVSELALDVFEALGARDYGRIDIRLDAHGTPHFLEANLIPSLIDGYGSFPKACALNAGMDYETMVLRIVTLASERLDDDAARTQDALGTASRYFELLETVGN